MVNAERQQWCSVREVDMVAVSVPGPEPDWEDAPAYQGGKRNPAFQSSMWEYAASSFRVVAGLQPPLAALAARLRLTIERGWEDLGYVDVAMFRIGKTDFALSELEGATVPYTFVGVSRSVDDVDAALDILLNALGIGREALAFRGTVETGFENCNGWPG
ncbi:hypothetical protein ACFVVA_06890 [Kitasatospora sp. NPDC058048]|uniref:hypothetical protein n=1 Tax=Kitasatospora sp. NPDC058048 TaxID=3346313 RepID=UPI0036D85E37